MARKNFSRLSFIGAGAAFLAACGGGASGPPRVSNSNGNRATGNGSSQVFSSSVDGRALAVHSSTGSLILSAVMGTKFARFTGPAGSFVVPNQLPASSGWYKVAGAKFRTKRLKSGKSGFLAVDASGNRVLFHLGKGGMLYMRNMKQKVTQKTKFFYDPSTKPALSGTAPEPTAMSYLSSVVTSPGTWHGDDDFLAKESSYSALADLEVTVRRPTSGRGKRLTEGRGGGDYGGDYGDGDGQGDGDGDGDGDCNPNVPPPSANCFWDQLGLAGAVLGGIASGLGGLAGCIVGGAFTFGLACGVAIGAAAAGTGAAAIALAIAWHAYNTDNCGANGCPA